MLNVNLIFNVEKFECLWCYKVKINVRNEQIHQSCSGRRGTGLRIAAPQETCIRLACTHIRLQRTCKCSANSRRQRVLSRELCSEILIHFRKSSRSYPQIVTRDERSRLTRIQCITVLDHEISLTLTVLARNPDCEIDYKCIWMLGANYTTLLIYSPIFGGANRVQFGSTFNV